MKNTILLLLAGLLCFTVVANAQSDSLGLTHTELLASESHFDSGIVLKVVTNKDGLTGEMALQFDEGEEIGDQALIIWVHLGPKNFKKYGNKIHSGDYMSADTFDPILRKFEDGFQETRATIKHITVLERYVIVSIL